MFGEINFILGEMMNRRNRGEKGWSRLSDNGNGT